MLVEIPTEVKEDENRVAITPRRVWRYSSLTTRML